MFLKHVKLVVEKCSTLTFSMLGCLLLEAILRSLIQKFSTFSAQSEQNKVGTPLPHDLDITHGLVASNTHTHTHTHTHTRQKNAVSEALKEGNCDQKYLRCPEFRDNNFEVLHS